jgi:hypothetical protein
VFTTVSVHTIAHNRGPKITPKVDAIARHQFRVLGELAQKASGHGPVLIGGDLNTQPGRQQTWPGKILKNAKLESNWQQLGTKGVGPGTHGHSFIDQFLEKAHASRAGGRIHTVRIVDRQARRVNCKNVMGAITIRYPAGARARRQSSARSSSSSRSS